MSNYPYSSGGQSGYSYGSSAYSTIPSYTQADIDAYYQRYRCYPPQPYNIIPTYYTPPAQPIASSAHGYPMATSGYYEDPGALPQPGRLAPPDDEETLQRRRSLKADRRSRSNSRTRTWQCDVPNCTSTANFTRLADFQRHQATVHGMGKPDFPCPERGCTRVGEKGFTRRDHLIEHLRNFHHLDIPKRQPGQRSANPLGQPYYQQYSD